MRTPREIGSVLQGAADIMRRIVGAPDYDTYVKHVRARHPHTIPLSREEFTRQRLADRYERPGARCC